MAADFAMLQGLVRATVKAAGQRLFALHFPEHTRSHLHILCMFTQFGPAVFNRLYFGAGAGLELGNRKSKHRNHGESWKNRAPKHGPKAVHSSTDHQWLVVA